MKMQANPATRSTTASRRIIRQLTTKYRFISVAIKPVTITDDLGVVHTVNVPQHPRTYNAGRNEYKRAYRACRRAGGTKVVADWVARGEWHG